ncbi:MAG: hypothetical protein KDK51_00370 [Deltaproteobacteria bacterium]|nr:hypothetical protein [Deltaproteobacteria bacterium]
MAKLSQIFSKVPNRLMNDFLFYKENVEKFDIYNKVADKYFSEKKNRIHFLEEVVDDLKELEEHELRSAFLELLSYDVPTHGGVQKRIVKTYERIIHEAYALRDFYKFEYFLQKIKKYDEIFELYYRYVARQFLEGSVSEDEWKALYDRAEREASTLFRSIASQYITKLIQAEDLDNAIAYLDKEGKAYLFGRHQYLRLSIGIIKLALKKKQPEQALAYRNKVIANIVDPELKKYGEIKLYEVTQEIHNALGQTAPTEKKHWEAVFDHLEDIPGDADNKSYIDNLRKQYRQMSANYTTLLDIRIDQNEQKQLYDKIMSHLREQKPMFMLRIGDADTYGFQNIRNVDETFLIDCQSREMKWWGVNLSHGLRKKLSDHFLETFYDCDVLGIPSIFRFVSDLPNLRTSFTERRNQRGSVMIMEQLQKDMDARKFHANMVFSENRCHQVLFTKEKVTDFFALANKVVVISNYDSDEMKQAFAGYDIVTIQVPKERTKAQSMPFKIDALIAEVESTVEKGDLVLVAAGFAGKCFLKKSKEKGAVALDVGAMGDYWLGHKTRGVSELV